MVRIAKKREIVKGDDRVEVREEWLKDLVEAEKGEVLRQIRGELFGLFKLLIERTMQLELEAMLGYAPYRKNGNGGGNSRNGYRKRKKLVLKEGLLENLKVPRDRNGEYRTEILPRLKRYEPAILDYVQQLYLNCNSTRPLSGMLTTLFGWPVSHSQVSNFCQVLDKEVEEWKKRPLADIYVGLFLDAVWLSLRRYRKTCEKECMLIALGVTKDGIKEVLGMRLVAEESAEGWAELLTELKARGLKGKELLLAFTDGNVLRYVLHHSKEAVAEMLENIYSSSCVEDALKRKDDFCAKWRKVFPSAVRSLETDFEDGVTFLKIKHFQLRKLFYSNNPIERINKEIKRLVRVMEMLPAEETAYRVVYWVVQKLSKDWRLRRVRGYAHLASMKQEFIH